MRLIDPEQIKAAKAIHERARYLRGRFLNSVAVIEHDLAEIITWYFCHDDDTKRELFFNTIASHLSLEKKKQIYSNILEIVNPIFHQNNKDLLQSLKQIQEFRNKLAHSIVAITDVTLNRPIDDGVGFVQWRKGDPITDDEFDDWEGKTGKVYCMVTNSKSLLGMPSD